MAELVAEEGVLKGFSFSLDEGVEWIIGRDPEECTIVLEDLKTSRKHLLIRKEEDDYIVENLSTTNPLELNGRDLLVSSLLQEGDTLKVGGTLFRFYRENRGVSEDRILEEKETIFRSEEGPPIIDLTPSSRFVLKVLSGPNSGAEYALELGKEYSIGSDSTLCDIVFHDLSVSREHAKLYLEGDGTLVIEDLESRNGVVVDRERISGKRQLLPNIPVVLGTSAFLIIDREAPSMTIVTPVLDKEEERVEERVQREVKPAKRALAPATLFIIFVLGGLLLLLGLGVISLFQHNEIEVDRPNALLEINRALKPFSGVEYTFNDMTSKLFLSGHITSNTERSALVHNLQGLCFLHGIEDNMVNDEAIWQEMNILLSKYPHLEGVVMHVEKAGQFILSGYLKTTAQRAELNDFLNINFLYPHLLDNRVVIEDEVIASVKGRLIQSGLNGVNVDYVQGLLTLTGFIPMTQAQKYEGLIEEFRCMREVKQLKNFVVSLSPEEAVVDLNERFPNRYKITGFSKCGDVNINVVVNGKIFARGDPIDGMTITSIQTYAIFLEKDGLKYKLEYNK